MVIVRALKLIEIDMTYEANLIDMNRHTYVSVESDGDTVRLSVCEETAGLPGCMTTVEIPIQIMRQLRNIAL